jgi:hypothetical protein
MNLQDLEKHLAALGKRLGTDDSDVPAHNPPMKFVEARLVATPKMSLI